MFGLFIRAFYSDALLSGKAGQTTWTMGSMFGLEANIEKTCEVESASKYSGARVQKYCRGLNNWNTVFGVYYTITIRRKPPKWYW